MTSFRNGGESFATFEFPADRFLPTPEDTKNVLKLHHKVQGVIQDHVRNEDRPHVLVASIKEVDQDHPHWITIPILGLKQYNFNELSMIFSKAFGDLGHGWNLFEDRIGSDQVTHRLQVKRLENKVELPKPIVVPPPPTMSMAAKLSIVANIVCLLAILIFNYETLSTLAGFSNFSV